MENEQTFINQPVREELPESLTILILGIVSIVINFIFPGIGLIPAIISLVKRKKAIIVYHENPERYTKQSYEYLKIGQITAIIGLVKSIIILSILLIYIAFIIVMLILSLNGTIQ